MSDTWFDSAVAPGNTFFQLPYSCQLAWDASFMSGTSSTVKIETLPANCLTIFDTSPATNMADDTNQKVVIRKAGKYLVHGFVYHAAIALTRDIRTFVDTFAGPILESRAKGGIGTDCAMSGISYDVYDVDQELELFAFLSNADIVVGDASEDLNCRYTVIFIGA